METLSIFQNIYDFHSETYFIIDLEFMLLIGRERIIEYNVSIFDCQNIFQRQKIFVVYTHRRRKRGDVSPPKFQVGGGGGIIPPKFQGFFFFFFACHPGGRCCVPRVPLPKNVKDVRKLSGKKKMGGSPPRSSAFLGVARATL